MDENIDLKLEAISHKHAEKLKKDNRFDHIFYGSLSLLYIVLGVVIFVTTKQWKQLFLISAFLFWVAIVWFQRIVINHYKYEIDMLTGLRDLERKEIDRFLDELDKAGFATQKNVKEVKI